ncbi:hypothetical protein [Corynebacterium sp. HMSC074A01]|uniref:hypothetical protein n=1 Tax=Corynebacterium sp. HMSC074A01 TaxID=1715030 RepID=UPI000A7224F0|nr:hypothetical protein [Corynebacterium sp. HMSC074A01]
MNDNIGSITFRNLSIKPRRIDLEAVNSEGSYPLWFEFDRTLTTSTNFLAVALSTLCGTKYDQIHFDFPVAKKIVDRLSLFTKAAVTSNGTEASSRPLGANITLSFSGGFDSLAAHRLLDGAAHLVSTDFGGWFEREATFFEKFKPLVVSTNVRRTPSQNDSFARNHWTFMCIGAILTAEYLESGFHVFGSILGERFARKPGRRSVAPLEVLGIRNVPITDGITELGTAKILAQTDGPLVAEAIQSLAGKTDRKRLLKLILATVAAEELGIDVPLPSIPDSWDKPITFDSSYTTALSTLYLIVKGKEHLIDPLYERIPESAFSIAQGLSLDFLMKVNTDFYSTLPLDLATQIAPRFLELGFSPYTETDWVEARIVRAYLNRVFDLAPTRR